MNREKRLIGCWAIVTGASSGIGLEFSRRLASLGCNVVMISNQDTLEKCATDLGVLYNVKALPLYLDLTDSNAVASITEFLDRRDITPRLLINNAGIFDFKAVNDLSESRINLYVDLHVRSLTHLSRTIAQRMSRNGVKGYILNMSSMSCWMPMPGIAMYSATKAYIRAFSRALRIEVKELGVSVTVACPGGIATNLFGLPPKLQHLGVKLHALDTPQRFVKKALRRTLQGRAQYINGGLNRMAIVAVASLPEWARLIIKTRLLDRINQ